MIPLRCQGGLNSLNFFIGAILTAFGPFFTVYLTEKGWSQADIGFALSVGTASALALQLPAGALIDYIDLKRIAIALSLVLIGVSALMVVAAPTPTSVLTSRVLQAFAGCLLTPAVSALTLKLVGHDAFSEQLGRNGRWASIGNAAAAATLGGVAYFLSQGTVFTFTALLIIPALGTLLLFRSSDTVEDHHRATHHPRVRRQSEHRPWHIFNDPVLYVFAGCVVLFQFANAAMLPLALNELAKRSGQIGFVLSAAVIVPQIVVAACSPWAGRLAQTIGRKPILLFGFAALPLRALLFMTSPEPIPLITIEALDGVSATVLGLTMPLIAADLTQQNGYLNLAIGALGLAAGLGATASTSAAGWAADAFGAPVAFFGMALVGIAALVVLWLLMPETRPGKPFTGQPAVVTA